MGIKTSSPAVPWDGFVSLSAVLPQFATSKLTLQQSPAEDN
jgi:hypothetical protein